MDSLCFVRLALALGLFSFASTAAAQSADQPMLPSVPPAPGALVEPALPPPASDLEPIPPAPDGYGLPSDAPPPQGLPPTGGFYAGPTERVAPPAPTCWDPDANRAAGLARDADRELGRCRRKGPEMVELYIMAGMLGVTSTVLLPEMSDDYNVWLYAVTYGIGPLAALGAVLALDVLMPFDGGVPGSIASGLALGALEYAFVASMALSDDEWALSAAGMWLSSLAGGVALGVLASQLQPTRAEIALVRSGAIWGGWLGLMGAVAAAAAGATDGTRVGFEITLASMNAGALFALLASATVSLSRGQVLGLDLGGLGGSLLGLLMGLSLTGGGGSGPRTDGPTIPLTVGVGTVAGMIIGVVLGKPYPRTPEEAQARALAFEATPYLQPRLGGGFTAGFVLTM